MPKYSLEPVNLSDSIWRDYSSEIMVIEADSEQQARFLAANRMAGHKLVASRGTSMPLPPCLVKEQMCCICLDG